MTKQRAELLGGILIVVAVCACVYFLAPKRGATPPAPAARGIETPPPLTDELAAQLARSKGFAVLVSYTESGFEPATVTIKKGETVRFVNNNPNGSLWVAATAESGARYPGSGGGCAQSDFDSCGTVVPGAFWEFTFTKSGTWSFKNNAQSAEAGTIIVQ